MTTQPEVVRQSDLLNQLVLDRSTLEELGRVEVLWIYLPSHRVLGLICKSGFLGTKKSAFQLDQIEAIGANGILTNAEPDPTEAEKVRQLESPLNCEVWSDAGNTIGKVTDYLFNPRTGTITQYLLVSSGWSGIAGDVYQLAPAQILNFGKKRILISEATAHDLSVYGEGIKQKLTRAGEVFKEEATQEWRSLSNQAQTIAEQAKERLQDLTEQAKERAQLLSKQAKEKVQTLNDQLKDGTQPLTDRMKERSRILGELMAEHPQTLAREEEGTQTLNVQAKEVVDPAAKAKADAVSPPSPPSALPQETHPTSFEADDEEPWI